MEITLPENITNETEIKVTKRFLRYIQVPTTSNEESTTMPSSNGQLILANLVKKELETIGLTNITLDENGYLIATLPANSKESLPSIGFLAHFDTSPAVSGENIKPQFHPDYDGSEIVLNKKKKITLSPKDYPKIKYYKGHTLITTDGTTLLGADDKSGIAEIITAMEYLINHPEIKHGKVMVCFTPDEEIGRGVDKINLNIFNPDFAYTIDGGGYGTLEYENFNAAHAKITIKGINVHPGYAKDKMINSITIANKIDEMLPEDERPENTEKYQGYYHLYSLNGDVEKTVMEYIIRDHDRNDFEKRKALIKEKIDSVSKKYNKAEINIEIKDQYYNMHEKIVPVMHIVKLAKEAIKETGLKPEIMPVRGGTDGARLSYMGIPCPNLFAGGMNFHSRYEYVSTEAMLYATQTIINVIRLND